MDFTPPLALCAFCFFSVLHSDLRQSHIKTLLPQGFHKLENRYVYVLGNEILNRGNENVCPYNPTDTVFSNASVIYPKDVIPWVKLFLEQGPDKSVLLLAAITPFLKPFTDSFNLPSKTITAFIVGKTGTGKTSFCRLLTSNAGINLGTDTAALYSALQSYTDIPVLIDDLNLSSSSREMEKKLERISSLIQLTSSGGKTIVRGKEIKISRLALLITAEYLPKASSTINRTVVIRAGDSFSSEALTELQASENMFNHFSILFLEWLLTYENKLHGMIADQLAKDTFEYKGRHGSQNEYSGFSRIMASHKLLKIAGYLLLTCLYYSNELTSKELERLSRIVEDGITTAISDTLELVRSAPVDSKILAVLLEILHTDPDKIMAKSYTKFKESKKLMFRYKDDYYYFKGETLARYFSSKCGEEISTKKLSAEFFDAKLLVPYGGELTMKLPLDIVGKKKHSKRYYRLSIPAMEDFLDKAYPGYLEKLNSPLFGQRNKD